MAEKPAKPPKGDWKSLHLWQIQGVRDVLVILGILGLLWLGQQISLVTVPLLLAILLAYLFEPVIVWMMERLKISRRTAVASILGGVIVLIGIPAILGMSYAVAQLVSTVNSAVTYAQVVQDAVELSAKLDAEGEPSGETPTPAPGADAAGQGGVEPGAAGTAGEQRGPEPEGQTPATPSEAGTSGGQDTAGDAANKGGLLTRAWSGVKRFFYPPPKPARPEVEELFRKFQKDHGKTKEFSRFWRGIYHRVRGSPDESAGVGRFLGAAVSWVEANKDQVAVTVANFGAETVSRVTGFAGALFGFGFMAFVTLFFFYFVSTEWIKLQGFGARLLPERSRDQVVHLLGRFDAVISGFIRGRLTIAFLQALVFSFAYLIIGVPGAFLLGPAVAILSIVPYLALVGLPVSVALLAAGDTEGFRGAWWWIVGAPTLVYFLGQLLDDYVWTPIIQGKSTGMDTPTILFASLAGGALFGVFGLLIAIPIAACLKILIQELFWPRFKRWADGKEKDFLPISRE